VNFVNPDDATLRALLDRVKTIAVAGLSPQPPRPGYRVAQAMQRCGYRIVPVRPLVDEVHAGRRIPAWPTFRSQSIWSMCFAPPSMCLLSSSNVWRYTPCTGHFRRCIIYRKPSGSRKASFMKARHSARRIVA
jgi:hypothetical protein